jgi:hypothetical protein
MALAAIEGNLLATPNYQFEKRQRDLAKKKKQEEKRRQKLADKANEGSGAAEDPSEASEAVASAERKPDA